MDSHSLDNEKLSSIMFISIPDSMVEEHGDLPLDPNKLLPVETGGDVESFDPSELRWESILSGMLKILAWEPDHSDAAYYRKFLKAVRPSIDQELLSAGTHKAQEKDYDLAEEVFRSLIGYDPKNTVGTVNLALLCEERARTNEKLGNTSLQQHYVAQARELYSDILSRGDAPADAYLQAGYFFAGQQQNSRALEAFSGFLSRADEDHGDRGKIQSYMVSIEQLAEHDELFKEAFDFIQLGQETKSLEKIDAFLEDHPDIWNAWFIKGWALRRLGRFEEALEAFGKANGYQPSHVDTMNEIAICHMELDDLSPARAILMKALKLDPENTKIMSNLGIVNLKKEEFGEARKYFETVLVYDPEDPIALRYIEALESKN